MKKRFSILFGLLLTLSLFLAACGGGEKAEEPAVDDGNGTTVEEPAEVAQELQINITSEPPALNPGLASDSTSGTVLLQTFEGLTRNGQDGTPEKAMAEDIQISDDLQTYTFTIRDAQWTNGDPVTAYDFEYAWEWVLDPANAADYAYQITEYVTGAAEFNAGEGSVEDVGITALDEKTLEVKLKKPVPYFLELTAFYTYFPVNSKIAKENPEWALDAGELYTSNGPFKMTEWSHNDTVVLEKNENYWDADAVKLDKIEMYMINDPNTELSMFENGEIDWAGSPSGVIPSEAIPSLKDEGILQITPKAGTYWYKFNTKVKPFDNANIRKAFAYAINRKAIVENVTKGGQVPAMAIVPPTMFPENDKGYFTDNDVETAKEFLQKGLEEEGYSSVEDLPEITLSFNTSEGHQKIAQAIQDMWKTNLGVNVGLENAEWGVYLDKIDAGDFQIGRLGWLGDYNDANNFLEMYKTADGGNNDTGWGNEDFKNLLEKASVETDADARVEMLKQAEQIFMDEMPVAPIYFYTNVYVKKDYLKDAVLSGLGDIQFKWAYIEE